MKQEKLICIKCQKEINPKVDDWYKTTLYNGKKINNEIFFHRECYKTFHKDKFEQEFNKKIKLVAPLLKRILPINN